MREPEKMDVFIFRENTEDVYIGIEWKSGSPEAKKLLEFLNNDMLKGGKKADPLGFRRRHQADFADRARSGWCGARSSTRWRTSARA